MVWGVVDTKVESSLSTLLSIRIEFLPLAETRENLG